MKKFLRKRWHSIPVALVAVLLALVLVTGGVVVASGYGFLSFTTVVTVAEPMTAEYNLWGKYGGDSTWHTLGDTDSLTIDGSAGDVFNLTIRLSNYASNALTVSTTITGDTYHLTFAGFPTSETIPGDPSPWVPFPVSVTINGDAPPGTYNVGFTFTRE